MRRVLRLFCVPIPSVCIYQGIKEEGRMESRSFQISACNEKKGNILVERHFGFLKKWGMKGNRLTFKLVHLF